MNMATQKQVDDSDKIALGTRGQGMSVATADIDHALVEEISSRNIRRMQVRFDSLILPSVSFTVPDQVFGRGRHKASNSSKSSDYSHFDAGLHLDPALWGK